MGKRRHGKKSCRRNRHKSRAGHHGGQQQQQSNGGDVQMAGTIPAYEQPAPQPYEGYRAQRERREQGRGGRQARDFRGEMAMVPFMGGDRDTVLLIAMDPVRRRVAIVELNPMDMLCMFLERFGFR